MKYSKIHVAKYCLVYVYAFILPKQTHTYREVVKLSCWSYRIKLVYYDEQGVLMLIIPE